MQKMVNNRPIVRVVTIAIIVSILFPGMLSALFTFFPVPVFAAGGICNKIEVNRTRNGTESKILLYENGIWYGEGGDGRTVYVDSNTSFNVILWRSGGTTPHTFRLIGPGWDSGDQSSTGSFRYFSPPMGALGQYMGRVDVDSWKSFVIYQKDPDPGTVRIRPNISSAGWKLYIGGALITSGTGSTDISAPPADYTIKWQPVSGYNTPPDETKYLPAGGSSTFTGTYTVQLGTINVNTNLATATFNISGPANYSGSGTSWSQTGATAGQYTITYGDVTGYTKPSSETKTLSAGGSITFTGSYQGQFINYTVTIRWWDDSSNGIIGDGIGEHRPLRFALVELYDEDIVFDDFLGSGTLDENGRHTFTDIQSDDPGGPDLYVKIILDSPVINFIDYGLADLRTQVKSNVTESFNSVDTMDHAEQSTYAYVFNTIQDLHTAWQNLTGSDVPQVNVRLLPEWYPRPPWDGRYDLEPYPGLDYNWLELGYDSNHAFCSAWNKFTIAHEYGHHIMYTAYGNNWPGDVTGMRHHLPSETDLTFALVEGWAEFVQNAIHPDWQSVWNSAYLVDKVIPDKYGGIYQSNSDIETNYWWMGPDIDQVDDTFVNPNGNSGSIVEGAVASILWDIYDSDDSDEPQGGIENGFSKIWAVISSSPHPQDIMDFYTSFIAKYPTDESKLNAIFSSHGIPKGVAEPGTINVSTNLASASFSITGPANYSGTGTSWSQTGALAGQYTITYGDVSGYTKPSSETKSLSPGGSITFTGTYSAQPGTINVSTNLAAASFSISGPANYSGSGTSWSKTGAPAGQYTITYGDVSGYTKPSSETKSLSPGGSITFTGTYTIQDDHPNAYPDGTPITVGSTTNGNIEVQSDHDIFKFSGEGGVAYRARAVTGTISATYVRVYDSAGQDVASSSEGDASWTAASSQTFYIEVWGSGTGTYQLHLTVTTIDSTAPTVNITALTPDPTTDNTPTFTGTAIDTTSTIASVEYKVDSGAWTAATASDGAFDEASESYTFTTAELSDGAHTVYVRATDSDTNTTTEANYASDSFTVDTTVPTVAITSTASSPTATSPIPMTATFSETVTGFVVGDISVGNGAASNFITVSGTVYTFDVTPTASGTVTVDIAAGVAQDAAGNGNTVATQFSITYSPTASAPTSLHTRLLAVMATRFDSIAELDGAKIISLSSSPDLQWIQTALATYGISFIPVSVAAPEWLIALQRGVVDAALVGAHPSASLQEAIASGEVRLLPWSVQAVEAVTDAYPETTIAARLPASTYEGQTESILGYAPPQPDITVSPTSIDFGSVTVGSSSSPQTVMVSNNGSANLTIGTISLSGTDASLFSIQNDNASGQIIAAGDNATLQVVLNPTSSGSKSATLTIPSNDPDENPVNVPLSGEAHAEEGVTIPLTYSEDLDKFRINWYRPQGIELTTEKPDGWSAVEPVYTTGGPLYGLLRFDESLTVPTVPVVVEEVEDNHYILYVDANLDNDLTNDQPLSAVSGHTVPSGVKFQLGYSDGEHPYKLQFYYWKGRSRLQYYRVCLREGSILLGGKERPLAILDDNANGIYSEEMYTSVIIDLNGDGVADGSHQSEELLRYADTVFYINETPYRVMEVARLGDSASIDEAQWGILKGEVTGAVPIAGAALVLDAPGGTLETTTDAEGKYEMKIPAGSYRKLIVRADGYVPKVLYEYELKSLVTAETSTIKNFSLTPIGALSGEITFQDGDSYHFLAREMHSHSGGDFYALLPADEKAMFWANNRGQGGLQDVGDIGNVPLDQVAIPDIGYQRYGVEAIQGHTYVSLAREGQEGHYIVFRVTEVVPGDHIILDYLYTPPLKVLVRVNVQANVVPDSDFMVTVDIGEVVDLNSIQYDISFDPSVLRLDDITAGRINSTEIPAQFSEISPGRYRVVQSMGLGTVSGSGYLATLHFHVIGSLGQSSTISISNGLLSGMNAEIPATWTGDSVDIVLPGDANGDNSIDVLDMTKVARIILKLDAETPGADVNLDGAVNVLDMTKIARIILMLD